MAALAVLLAGARQVDLGLLSAHRFPPAFRMSAKIQAQGVQLLFGSLGGLCTCMYYWETV